MVTSETAGRLLGIATQTPSVVEMMEDLLTPDAGFAIAERPVEPKEVGGSPRHLTDIVLGVVRNGDLLRVDDERVDALGADRSAALHPLKEAGKKTDESSRSATSRCCPGSGPTAPTPCAPISTPRSPAGPTPLVLRVDRRNQVLIAGGSVVLGKATGLGDSPPEQAVFLGRLADGRHVWAIRAGAGGARGPDTWRSEVLDLRRAGAIFDDASAQLVSTATALLNWHDNARYSPVDGAPTKSIKAGWSRLNPDSGHEEFPRIDPAVICLVHDGHDRAVLARQGGLAGAAVLGAGRVRGGGGVLRSLRGARDRRGGRSRRHRCAIPGQPAVAVPAVAHGGFPRPG